MNRRKFLKKTLLGTLGVGVGVGLYTWKIEPYWLEFVHKRMPIPHLPNPLVGKTLMQISDIHVGNRFDYHYIIDSFQKAQQYQPDIVVYTGDYVTYENEKQFYQLKEVLPYVLKGKLGTFGILGNHDYGKNWMEQKVADTISEQLHKAGIYMLHNTKTEVEGLHIIGLDDYWGLNFNPETVMATQDPTQAQIVLCHNPDVCDLAVWNGYQSWILSGHTHGGQCKPPFLPAPNLPIKNPQYAQGEIHLQDGRKLYVNRALGNLWPVRFNVRPEITLFTLEKA